MIWPPGMSKSPFTTQGHVLHPLACAMRSFLLWSQLPLPGFSLIHKLQGPQKSLS